MRLTFNMHQGQMSLCMDPQLLDIKRVLEKLSPNVRIRKTKTGLEFYCCACNAYWFYKIFYKPLSGLFSIAAILSANLEKPRDRM